MQNMQVEVPGKPKVRATPNEHKLPGQAEILAWCNVSALRSEGSCAILGLIYLKGIFSKNREGMWWAGVLVALEEGPGKRDSGWNRIRRE